MPSIICCCADFDLFRFFSEGLLHTNSTPEKLFLLTSSPPLNRDYSRTSDEPCGAKEKVFFLPPPPPSHKIGKKQKRYMEEGEESHGVVHPTFPLFLPPPPPLDPPNLTRTHLFFAPSLASPFPRRQRKLLSDVFLHHPETSRYKLFLYLPPGLKKKNPLHRHIREKEIFFPPAISVDHSCMGTDPSNFVG